MADLIPNKPKITAREDAAAHDEWFRAKVKRAMTSKGLGVPHDQVMAMARARIDQHKTK
ncbi:stability determinant [uncultured Sphingomonas sp.]|uniref:type II toxin-antitoxin system RelB family antitoxin n=1 Tax=uncultured Sphingomonas sp. TaxID=158754 RepID=UPI0035CB6913